MPVKKKMIRGFVWGIGLLLIILLSMGCERVTNNNDPGDDNNPDPLVNENWVEMGPAPIKDSGDTGRVAAIAVSTTDENLYYVGGADGGVWKSTDAGASWTPLTDHLPTTAIGAVAIDPKNDDIVYAGTGEANFANHSRYGLGLYKTNDGGKNWQVSAEKYFAGRCFSKIVIDPEKTNILYAAITHAGGLPSFDFNIAAARGHKDALLPLGVWKSTDGGSTWSQLTNHIPGDLSATDIVMDPADSSTLYAAVGHVFGDPRNGIYKTVNKGTSWTKCGGGLPVSGVGRIALAVSKTEPRRIYAGIIDACDDSGAGGTTLGVFRSDDGGINWTVKRALSIHSSYGWYLNVIAVSPTDADVVFYGGVWLCRTTDGGETWEDVQGDQHADHHALVFDKAGRLLSGNDGGVYRSADLGGSWTAINNGLGIIQFYAGISLDAKNPDIIYGGTQDNGTLKRTGTGTGDWIRVFYGDGGCTGIKPDDSHVVFCEYQGTGNLFKSTDMGNNFSSANAGIDPGDANCFLPPFMFHPENPDEMYYFTQRAYKSSNAGHTWNPVSGNLTGGGGAAVRGFAISPANPDTLYAGTNDGRILVSNDGGSTWKISLKDVPGWPRIMRQFAVDPYDHLTAYLAVSFFGVDQILVTRDGGNAWNHLDDLADIPVNTIALDSGSTPPVIYIGTDSGVFRSTDGGGTWNRYGKGLPNCPVNDMIVDTVNDRLIVATQGRGMWLIGI